MLGATAHATEVSELSRKLQLADEELDRINKLFDETQGMQNLYIRIDMCIESFNLFNCVIMITVGAAEIESLKSALAQAQKEVNVNKVAADKAAKELEAEQIARCKHEARVAGV